MGVMMLQSEQCNVALCGGAEAPFTEGGIQAWKAMRVLASDCCRPFSAGRGGVILGEGSAHLVLEKKAHALARGATVLAEVSGFGMSSDASHFVAPTVEGPMLSMQKALRHANLAPEKIDYINAHGSGTEQNDNTETAAIHRVFADHAPKLAVSSTKSMHGHSLGAAGAMEAAACITALQEQCAPATINYQQVDPNCDLDYVPNEVRRMGIEYAMSNSFAFGGLNVSLIFKRAQILKT
jgi:nodulation protein E